jgi:predicted metal-binding membrane protein
MAFADASTQAHPRSEALPVASLPLAERIAIWGGLAGITALAWLYLVRMPMTPASLGGFGERILSAVPPRIAELWLNFMMWAVMMVAMMVPSASPMPLMYARIARGRKDGRPHEVWLFAAGYLVVWTIFSAAATAGQFVLQRAALLTVGLIATPLAGGIILAVAGIYQLTPLKNACLGHCRSPMGFFMTEWRDGAAGAFRMGLKHGAYCAGCCWMLMALLFVMGVMNLLWVAAISVLVLIEKATPFGRAIARTSGVAMIAGGALMPFFT